MRNTKTKNKNFAVLVYGHVYFIMFILRSQNKITDFDDFTLIVSH